MVHYSMGSLELRTGDLHHSTSIPTPVSSTSSTPTFQGIKRKFEEPPHLELSDQNPEKRVDFRDSGYRSSISPPPSLNSERSSQSSPGNHSVAKMSFLITFVIDKISSFTGELWSQLKPSPSSPEDRAESDSSEEPAQEPTPEPTPERTLEPAPKPISKPAKDDRDPIASKSPTSDSRANLNPNLKKTDDIRSKAKAFAVLKDTLARRDAPKKKLSKAWPTVSHRDSVRRDQRLRVANVSGSPFASPRFRGEDRRRPQRRRPLARIELNQIEEARKARPQDPESLNAYIAWLPKHDDHHGFKNFGLIVKERESREAEIQRLRELHKEPIVKPLSEATLAEVQKVMHNRQRGKVLIENTKARVMIYVDDMWRLNPYPPRNDPLLGGGSHTLWLNDAIIDLYLYMVAEKANAKSEVKKVHACTTFFWSLLLKNGPKKVENITRKAKIGGDNFLRLDLFLVPINFDNNHWALGVVKPAEKRIEFYDSWRSGAHRRAQTFFQTIRVYLVHELKDRIKISKPWDEWWGEWTDCFIEDCPSQNNAYDCGVFTCKHAEVIARGRELSFTQADMPTIRYRMVAELMKGELGVD